MSRFGPAVRRKAGKQKDLGSIPLQLSSLKKCGIVTLSLTVTTGTLLSLTQCTNNLGPPISETSPEGNDSELWGENGGQERGVSRLRVLIG